MRAIASSFGSHSARAMSVFTSAGATAFTRTPGASSSASWRVRWTSAAFETLYAPMNGPGRRPPTETTLRITPPCSRMYGRPRGLREAQRAADVRRPHLLDRAHVGVDERTELRVRRRVVHEDVEPPSALDAVLDGLLDDGRIAGRARDRRHRAPRSPRAADAVSASSSGLRAFTHTAAPAAASASAIARPMPFVAPVTSATCPSTRSAVAGSITGGRLGPPARVGRFAAHPLVH